MGEVTITRHGQANSGAKSELEYDKLSELGHVQARWLGEYLQDAQPYTHIISGSLRRQRETAEGILAGLGGPAIPHTTDARLNELDYFALSDSLTDMHGVPFPDSAETFAAHVPQILSHWAAEATPPHVESYAGFRTRIFDAVRDASLIEGRVLLVSSTGVIASLTALALGLETTQKAKMFLNVAHTSLHGFDYRTMNGASDLHMTMYGSTPHLDRADRTDKKTMV